MTVAKNKGVIVVNMPDKCSNCKMGFEMNIMINKEVKKNGNTMSLPYMR